MSSVGTPIIEQIITLSINNLESGASSSLSVQLLIVTFDMPVHPAAAFQSAFTSIKGAVPSKALVLLLAVLPAALSRVESRRA
jgi:hypothetical protein